MVPSEFSETHFFPSRTTIHVSHWAKNSVFPILSHKTHTFRFFRCDFLNQLFILNRMVYRKSTNGTVIGALAGVYRFVRGDLPSYWFLANNMGVSEILVSTCVRYQLFVLNRMVYRKSANGTVVGALGGVYRFVRADFPSHWFLVNKLGVSKILVSTFLYQLFILNRMVYRKSEIVQ